MVRGGVLKQKSSIKQFLREKTLNQYILCYENIFGHIFLIPDTSNRIARFFHGEEGINIAIAPTQASEPGRTGIIGAGGPEPVIVVVAGGHAPCPGGGAVIGAESRETS